MKANDRSTVVDGNTSPCVSRKTGEPGQRGIGVLESCRSQHSATPSLRFPTRGSPIFSCFLLSALCFFTAAQAQTAITIKSFGALTNITGFSPQSTLVQGPDGTLYGTASDGEGSVAGTLFKVQPDGTGYTMLKWFTNSIEGATPVAGLALSGSVLYGTTAYGGSSNFGTVFRINTDGTGYTVLKNFIASDGATPYYANLVLSSGVLYGVTYYGGSSSNGTVFKLNTDGTGFSNLHSFTALHQCPSGSPCPYGPAGTNSDGANPNFALTLSGSVLYGTAENGGTWGYGAVFRMNTDGTGYIVLRNFTDEPDGSYPDGVLTLSGNTLYGTTLTGGELVGGSYYRLGTVFRVNTDGTGYAILKSFSTSDGGNPSGALPLEGNALYGTGSGFNPTVFRVNTDGTGFTVLRNLTWSDGGAPCAGLMLSGSVLYGTSARGGSPVSGSSTVPGGTVFRQNTDGTGFTVLEDFVYRDGGGPAAGVTLSNGVLYGTTIGGDGPGTNGTVFTLNTDGTGFTVLKSFANPLDGASPYSDLTLSGNVLYGTTTSGGGSNYGTVFKVNSDGTAYSALRNFTGGDGATPYSDLALADGVLYGTTYQGGSSNYGTVFKLNTDGTGYTVLRNFTNSPDGNGPGAGLALADGVLYGTTYLGGSSGEGTVFKMNIDGTGFKDLHDFTALVPPYYTNADGANPEVGLTLSGGVLYGTTSYGGGADIGTVFKVNTDGTGFTVLKSFTGSDGAYPNGLTLLGNMLYGTTEQGGSFGVGTLFQVNTDGTGYTVVKHFTDRHGSYPLGTLTLSGSTLYGTTSAGGSFGEGTVFKLDLSPLLTLQPLGNAVVLNWTNPAFSLQSAPEVTGAYTNIPGATSPYTNASAGGNQFFRLIGN